MLRLLSIRNFVVVEALDVEFAPGFTVLTGETGAGKSILLDALGLLLGDRFDLRQLRPGAARAELAAEFAVADAPGVGAWLSEHGIADDDGDVLLRRVFDAQGKSRAWINGSPATLLQLKDLGERLVDLHGQHAHQAIAAPAAQRALLDAFGGFSTLNHEVGAAWRAWQAAIALRDAAASAAEASASERGYLEARSGELAALGVTAQEWSELTAAQSRLAHAATLLETATQGEEALAEGDDALCARLAQLLSRLDAASAHDPALKEIVALLEPAAIQVDEAARALRDYRRRLDLDPAELARVEARLAAIHDTARKHRVRPDALPALLAETDARLAALADAADAGALAQRAAEAEARYRELAEPLSSKRRFAATELAHRVTAAMQQLAMAGGRLDVKLIPEAAPASHGLERVELNVATHPKQPLGALARVASGGELSRIALAIQVVTSETGQVPTLVFDEVDTGIGGTVAATVGRSLQALGRARQVLCVTHLAQVAAHADQHIRVSKAVQGNGVATTLERLDQAGARVEELARMLSGSAITAKTRAHARELFEQHRRPPP
ncbi:MAG: DNA repair protein RecN [Casimicrobiaceae bacterium]